MDILFVVPYAPTPIRTRPYHFLKHLARGGHRITLGTLYADELEAAALAEIEGWGIRVLAAPLGRPRIVVNLASAFLRGVPLQARYSWNPDLARQMLAVEANIVHVEHLRGAIYGIELMSGRRRPVVWDSVDSISHLFAQAAEKSLSLFGRIAGRLELGRTRRYEGRMTARFDRVLVTSAQDCRALEELARPYQSPGPPQISVIPNGVDTARFHPIDDDVQPDTIIFTGKMSYHANVTAVVGFVRDVMPLVWQQRPQARLQVVGKDPDRLVQDLAADPRVEVIGTVPELAPYLGRAMVAVAPIAYGAGIQNKILEAMACRTPVVASPQAVTALQAESGKELLVASNPKQFAQNILFLMEHPDAREALAAAGNRFVLKNHRWEEGVERLEEIYHGAIQAFR